ncbi:hypothetical protein F5Y07DRAFT_220466 [Xylaria sp. FL0933]|nr:hypothetical protein F5Y07DRAFT_220466 [Xylaria sp. FL0933]
MVRLAIGERRSGPRAQPAQLSCIACGLGLEKIDCVSYSSRDGCFAGGRWPVASGQWPVALGPACTDLHGLGHGCYRAFDMSWTTAQAQQRSTLCPQGWRWLSVVSVVVGVVSTSPHLGSLLLLSRFALVWTVFDSSLLLVSSRSRPPKCPKSPTPWLDLVGCDATLEESRTASAAPPVVLWSCGGPVCRAGSTSERERLPRLCAITRYVDSLGLG